MATESKESITSFRWSVLPQDAERLCVQELARSPSSSCQHRGVCRERNPMRQSGFSGRLQGSSHFLVRSGGSLKASLSSGHQPPEHCRPLLFFEASPPALSLSQSTSSRKPSLISQQGQTAFTLVTFTHGFWPQLFQVLPKGQVLPSLSQPAPEEHRLREPPASSFLDPLWVWHRSGILGALCKTSY